MQVGGCTFVCVRVVAVECVQVWRACAFGGRASARSPRHCLQTAKPLLMSEAMREQGSGAGAVRRGRPAGCRALSVAQWVDPFGGGLSMVATCNADAAARSTYAVGARHGGRRVRPVAARRHLLFSLLRSVLIADHGLRPTRACWHTCAHNHAMRRGHAERIREESEAFARTRGQALFSRRIRPQPRPAGPERGGGRRT